MLDNANNTSLNSIKQLKLSSTASAIQGRLGGDGSYSVYSFRLKSRSKLNVNLRNSRGNADLELIQDRNSNQLLSPGEIVASSRASGTLRDSISITGLEPGTYFLRVSAVGDAQSQFQYRFSASAKPTQNKSFTYQVVELTNEQRVRNGLLPLAVNTQLSSAAQKHTQNMALQDFFSHTGLDGSSPTSRMLAEGYDSYGAAENIYAGITNPRDAIEGWMDSPGHRANILNSGMTEIGVGYFYNKDDGGREPWNYYWTQKFSTPGY